MKFSKILLLVCKTNMYEVYKQTVSKILLLECKTNMYEVCKQTVRQTDKRRTKGDKRFFQNILSSVCLLESNPLNKLKSNRF